MASRLRSFDWRSHPLGAPEGWPDELRLMIDVCLSSTAPAAIYWGSDLRLIYNDAWAPIPADRHPAAIGEPAREVWSDIWDVVGPQFDDVVKTGRGYSAYDQRLMMMRRGSPEETYWNYSFTPIRSREGAVLGILNEGYETTDKVIVARDQAFLLELGDGLRDGDFDAAETMSVVLGAIGAHLGLARVGYATIDESGTVCSVVANWHAPRVADISAGHYPLSDFGDVMLTDLVAGRIVAADDVTSDARHQGRAAENFMALAIRANLVAPVVRNGRAIAFVFLNDDRPRRWTRHEIALAREAAGRIWTALDRADATARLRASERRFTAIYEQAAVGLSEVDQQGRFLRFNDSMGRILGRSPAEAATGLSVADVTHPDDMAETRSRVAAPVAAVEPFELEKRYVRPDGSIVWAVTQVTQLVDDRNEPSGFFSVTTDVTERKEQERIRAWLLAELNHRVKNNLSTVQALAQQTVRSAGSVEEFEAIFNARLMALSRAHDLLMRETWTSAALGDLASETLAPFTLDGGDRIMIGGPEVRLSPTAAVTMTLALHELATNAAKFGALSQPDGRVSVKWSFDPNQNGGVVDLEWREAGGPIVPPPSRRGFGSRLIERGAARELGGRVRLDFEPDGVACAFHLPLSQKIMVP